MSYVTKKELDDAQKEFEKIHDCRARREQELIDSGYVSPLPEITSLFASCGSSTEAAKYIVNRKEKLLKDPEYARLDQEWNNQQRLVWSLERHSHEPNPSVTE